MIIYHKMRKAKKNKFFNNSNSRHIKYNSRIKNKMKKISLNLVLSRRQIKVQIRKLHNNKNKLHNNNLNKLMTNNKNKITNNLIYKNSFQFNNSLNNQILNNIIKIINNMKIWSMMMMVIIIVNK